MRGRGATAFAAVCAVTAISVATAGTAATAVGGAKGGGCSNATTPAAQLSAGKLGKAVHCLINVERDKAGRKDLDRDRKLTKAAKKHTKQMVKTNCLDHQCGGEPDLFKRIKRTGYFSGAQRFDFAEDVGCETSADQMVRRWMASSLHRKNILNRKFKDAGVGASNGRISSRCSPGYATYTIVFGFRAG